MEIQELSEVPGSLPLFESLLVFENYPWDSSLGEQGRNLEIRNLRGGITTNYPLTIVAVVGPELSLRIIYECCRFDADTIARMLGHFQALLERIVANPEQRVADLLLLVEAARQQRLIPNGKAGRQALPGLNRERPELDVDFVAPRTSMESLIAEIWQDLLGVDRVGVYDNFFDLGGYSLLSMRVVARIEKAVGLRLNPTELIFQSLEQLAAVCEERTHLRPESEPISFAQRLFSPFRLRPPT